MYIGTRQREAQEKKQSSNITIHCSLLNLDLNIAVCYKGLYNALCHIIFLLHVRQAAQGCSQLLDFCKDFCHM